MKIRRLEIQGFKSFADRTVVHFDDGITCVVGPNGCGKSNIVDSLRWCLGEQSAKHLRGDGMQDVIFGGSEARGPVGMAEVSITFANDGVVHGEWSAFPEITVSRRLYRTGESEYLINRNVVRLKDVQDLVLGTGIGTKGYSIIEQGRIGMIVSSRAEDRRQLIEEAAGITKYKSRRQAAERKMEATRQNLLRVGDLVTELGKRLVVVKRQAARAEKYKALKAELREIELHDAALKHLELVTGASVGRDELVRQQEHVTGQGARLAVMDADVELLRIKLLEEEKTLGEQQTRLYAMDQEMRLAEQDAAHQEETAAALEKRAAEDEIEAGKQRARLSLLEEESETLAQDAQQLEDEFAMADEAASLADSQLTALMKERDGLTRAQEQTRQAISELANKETAAHTHVEQLERRQSEIKDRQSRYQDELYEVEGEREAVTNSKRQGEEAVQARRDEQERLQDEKETVADQLATQEAQLQDASGTVNRVQEELGRKRQRLHGLEEVHSSLARAPEGVRVVMGWGRSREVPGIHGLLPDFIQAPSGQEAAVAAALAGHMDDVVVEDVSVAAQVAQRLRKQGKGRATLLPRNPKGTAPARPPVPQDGLAPDAVLGWMADGLSVQDGMQQAVGLRLGDVLVVKDMDAALALLDRGFTARVVTLQGDLVHGSGEVTGGSADEGSQTYLRQRREMTELSDAISGLEKQMRAADDVRSNLHYQVEELRLRARRASEGLQGTALRLLEAEKDLARLADQDRRLQSRWDSLRAERLRCEEQLAGLSGEQRGHLQTLERANAERLELEDEVTAIQVRLAATDASHMEASARAMELKVKAQSTRDRREHLKRSIQSAQRSRQEMQDLVGRLVTQATSSRTLRAELLAQSSKQKQKAMELASVSAAQRGQLEAARAAYEEAQARLAALDGETRSLRNEVAQAQAALTELTVGLRERELALTHLHGRIREAYQLELKDVLWDYHLRPLPPASTSERVGELRKALDGMGEINLTAIEECRDVEQRHTFLRTQQDDLTHALNQLEKAITRINKTTRRRFQEAFDAINERFQELFPRLFRGGKAWLQLTRPDDLLETGIEIFAQPPGKKLSTVQLLSGGEKALTAVSLVFSIFLIKPSPFCLMDEVDAPLDEANVVRFNELVKDISSLSQFILITHNKRTMEIADNFYGITMEEPGVSKLVNVRMSAAHAAVQPHRAAVAPLP